MPAPIRPTVLSYIFFVEGNFAGAVGDLLCANPYAHGTVQHDRWREGWYCSRQQARANGRDAAR